MQAQRLFLVEKHHQTGRQIFHDGQIWCPWGHLCFILEQFMESRSPKNYVSTATLLLTIKAYFSKGLPHQHFAKKFLASSIFRSFSSTFWPASSAGTIASQWHSACHLELFGVIYGGQVSFLAGKPIYNSLAYWKLLHGLSDCGNQVVEESIGSYGC